MQILIEQIQGKVPVTVVRLEGSLDGTNYQDLVRAAEGAYQDGARDLLLDLDKLSFMSSAGIVAVQQIHQRFDLAELPPDPVETGAQAIDKLESDKLWGRMPAHFKLLCPHDRVLRALRISGVADFFEIFTDEAEAIAAFG